MHAGLGENAFAGMPEQLASVASQHWRTRRGPEVQPNRFLGLRAQHAHAPPTLPPRFCRAVPHPEPLNPPSPAGRVHSRPPSFPLRSPSWLAVLPPFHLALTHLPPPSPLLTGFYPFASPRRLPFPIAGHSRPRQPRLSLDRTPAHRLIEARWRVLRLQQTTQDTGASDDQGFTTTGNWVLNQSDDEPRFIEGKQSASFGFWIDRLFFLHPLPLIRLTANFETSFLSFLGTHSLHPSFFLGLPTKARDLELLLQLPVRQSKSEYIVTAPPVSFSSSDEPSAVHAVPRFCYFGRRVTPCTLRKPASTESPLSDTHQTAAGFPTSAPLCPVTARSAHRRLGKWNTRGPSMAVSA